MSYLSQMVALTIHNFVLRRHRHRHRRGAGARHRAAFGQDARQLLGGPRARVTYYLLLPICLVFAVFLVSQGMIQNFKPYTKAKLVEPYTIQVPSDEKNDKGRSRSR